MKMILFTQRVELVESYGERRDCADQRIVEFLEVCGYMPVPLPNVIQDIEAYVRQLRPSGIVLTGGNSLEGYGGNAPERDRTDRTLLRISLKQELPLYGFCRGMQSILDYFGCPLSQVEGHVAKRHPLKNARGETIREVNSYHNQAAYTRDVKEPLEVTACTEDSIVEAIRHREKKIMGTMWHPEREKEFLTEDIAAIQELFQ